MKNVLKKTASYSVIDMIKVGACVGTVGLLTSPAFAQVENTPAPEEDEVNRLGVITVEARKTAEDLQDVPIAVTAFTGDFFQDSGLVEFSDISAITPNFDVQEDAVQGALFSNLTIRGQTALNGELSSDQAVGIIINGAPVTRGTNLFSNLFDVEQIEVLKGPQGTLFGKNTTGGAVIVRTTAPQLGEFSGYGEVDFGNFGRQDFEGVINIPMGDTFALRLGAAKQDRDGFGYGTRRTDLTDTVGFRTGTEFADDDEVFYRASALFEPNEQLSIRVNADYHEVDEAGSINRVINDGLLFGFIPIAIQTLPANDIFASSHQQDYAPTLIAEETNLNATIAYDFGNVTLESITSFREQNSESATPFAGAADIFNGQDSELFAQELRLSGQADRLNWQTGVFYSTEEGIDLDDVGGSEKVTEAQNDSIAIFGQGTYELSDRLNVTAGLRYTDEERALAQTSHATEPLVPEVNASFDGLSWTLGLDYEVSDSVLTYATVSRGFRSGAIDDEVIEASLDPLITIDDITIDPEFVTNYEIGLKGDFFDNTLRWNTAIWYSDYKDIQVQVFDPNAVDSGGNAIIVVRNGAAATLYGFESELEYVPTDNFTLGAAIGYTKGDFDEFIDVDSVTGLEFDRSDEAIGGPEWQFSAFTRYDFTVSDNVSGGAQLNYTYRGEEELLGGADVAFFADPGQTVLDSYGVFNGQLDFDIESWNTNVAFYGRNLLDEEYDASGFALVAFGLDLAQRIPGAPQEYGVRVRKTF